MGEECPKCQASHHMGIWDGKRWTVCYVCRDTGILDEQAIMILQHEAIVDAKVLQFGPSSAS
jgi:hypothetical protein